MVGSVGSRALARRRWTCGRATDAQELSYGLACCPLRYSLVGEGFSCTSIRLEGVDIIVRSDIRLPLLGRYSTPHEPRIADETSTSHTTVVLQSSSTPRYVLDVLRLILCTPDSFASCTACIPSPGPHLRIISDYRPSGHPPNRWPTRESSTQSRAVKYSIDRRTTVPSKPRSIRRRRVSHQVNTGFRMSLLLK